MVTQNGDESRAENIDRTPIDKSSWGIGPWQQEPDRVEWEHAGLPCLALRSPRMGNWCGYVAVPPDHSLHGVDDYHAPDVNVHGGLTYASACDGERICHVPKPGGAADVWWFGFDCGHAGDFSPAMYARTRHLDPLFDDGPCDHATAVAANTWQVPQYRTLDYVQGEVNRLAEQLAQVSGGGR